MKIAVCFNGQLRTGIKSSKNILNFLGDTISDIDFFVHTWDTNSSRAPLNLKIPAPPIEYVSDKEIRDFVDIYNPVNIIVESTDKFFQRVCSMYGDTGDLVHIWHSGWHSVQLKTHFEELNNFTYDAVIRLRPDCIFPEDRRLSRDLDELLKNPNIFYYQDLWGDVYQLATSDIMNSALDFYRYGKFYGDGFWPMPKFLEYLTSKDIQYKMMDDNRLTIFRKEYDYLDPIQHYKHLNVINSFIFEDINFAKNGIISTYQNLDNKNWVAESVEDLSSLFTNPDAFKIYLKS